MNEQQQVNPQQQQVNPRGNQLPIAGRPQQRARQRERNINAASQYSSHEIQGILQVIEAILPIHCEVLEEVAQIHAQNFPTMQQTSDSIKRKLQALYRSKKPTGDPFCPPEVRKAKQLRHDIAPRVRFPVLKVMMMIMMAHLWTIRMTLLLPFSTLRMKKNLNIVISPAMNLQIERLGKINLSIWLKQLVPLFLLEEAQTLQARKVRKI